MPKSGSRKRDKADGQREADARSRSKHDKKKKRRKVVSDSSSDSDSRPSPEVGRRKNNKKDKKDKKRRRRSPSTDSSTASDERSPDTVSSLLPVLHVAECFSDLVRLQGQGRGPRGGTLTRASAASAPTELGRCFWCMDA